MVGPIQIIIKVEVHSQEITVKVLKEGITLVVDHGVTITIGMMEILEETTIKVIDHLEEIMIEGVKEIRIKAT